MLVLSRKVGEQIVIGDNITVVVRRVSRDRVSLAIEAPAEIRIMRKELESFADDFSVESASGDSPARSPDRTAGAFYDEAVIVKAR